MACQWIANNLGAIQDFEWSLTIRSLDYALEFLISLASTTVIAIKVQLWNRLCSDQTKLVQQGAWWVGRLLVGLSLETRVMARSSSAQRPYQPSNLRIVCSQVRSLVRRAMPEIIWTKIACSCRRSRHRVVLDLANQWLTRMSQRIKHLITA